MHVGESFFFCSVCENTAQTQEMGANQTHKSEHATDEPNLLEHAVILDEDDTLRECHGCGGKNAKNPQGQPPRTPRSTTRMRGRARTLNLTLAITPRAEEGPANKPPRAEGQADHRLTA